MTNQRIWDHYQRDRLQLFASARPRLSSLLDRAARQSCGRSLRILNVGIGDGTLERLALARGWEVDALDPSENAVTRSMAMGIRAHRGGIESMPYADASFDAVFCSEVFEHLTPDQLQAALPEIVRVLRPDGRLYGTVPFDEPLDEQRVICPHCGEEFHRWGHQQAFTVDQIRAALSTTLAVERADVVNFVDWRALNWKGRVVAAVKTLLSLLGVHGRNENIVFVAHRRAP